MGRPEAEAGIFFVYDIFFLKTFSVSAPNQFFGFSRLFFYIYFQARGPPDLHVYWRGVRVGDPLHLTQHLHNRPCQPVQGYVHCKLYSRVVQQNTSPRLCTLYNVRTTVVNNTVVQCTLYIRGSRFIPNLHRLMN